MKNSTCNRKMFVSILLGRFGPWLLPAVVIGFILFFLLTFYCYWSRHKRAKLRLGPKLSNDLYVESLSELPVVEVRYNKVIPYGFVVFVERKRNRRAALTECSEKKQQLCFNVSFELGALNPEGNSR